MKSKQIVIISNDFYPNVGGIADYLLQFCIRLQKTSHYTITVITQSPSIPGQDANLPFRIIRLNKKKLPGALKPLAKIINYLSAFYHYCHYYSEHKKEIAYLICGQIESYPEFLLILSKLFNIPLISIVYAMEVTQKVTGRYKYIHKLRLNCALKYAKLVITISHFTEDKIKKLFPAIKTIIIKPGITNTESSAIEAVKKEKQQYKTAFSLEQKQVVLTIARLVERKGIDTVINSIALLQQKFPNLVYLVGGDGPDRSRLQALVSQKGLEKSVKFTGYLTELQKFALYELCDLFVMVPRELPNGDVEGFGIVYLEANLHSKPVIGSTSGGVSDAIEHGKSGLLVDPKSSQDLARQIDSLLSDSHKAQAMGVYGKKRASSEFDWDYLIKDLIAVLK